jgi:acyl-CoA hydrolase
MAAYRHSRTNVVTAAMDHIDFIQPVHLGDLVTLKSSVNRAFTSSMEVGVKVWAENTRTGEVARMWPARTWCLWPWTSRDECRGFRS